MATESPPLFVHLRAHSAYSLSEGALHIKAMASLAKDAGMPALAISHAVRCAPWLRGRVSSTQTCTGIPFATA